MVISSWVFFFSWHLWKTGTCWCAGSSEDLVCVCASVSKHVCVCEERRRGGEGGDGGAFLKKRNIHKNTAEPKIGDNPSQTLAFFNARHAPLTYRSLRAQKLRALTSSRLRGVFNLSFPPPPSSPPSTRLLHHHLSISLLSGCSISLGTRSQSA